MYLSVIFLIYIIVLGIIYFDAIIKIIKSKNYCNCKKLITLSLIICIFFAITFALSPIILNSYNIFESFILFFIGGLVISINAIMIMGIITFILYIFMKTKKYNTKENTLSFNKKYKLIIILGLIILSINFMVIFISYHYNNLMRKNNALYYYESKYSIDDKIVSEEKILKDSDNITLIDQMEGIVYQLESGNKVYYDVWNKKYYDNKQDKEIQKFINNYYQKTFDEIINELKIENPNSMFLDTSDEIKLYSNLINADTWIDYLYYDEKEFYFNEYYDLALTNEDEIIKNIFTKNEIDISHTTVQIACDRNGNWDNIVNKYLYRFEFEQLNVNFEFYDFNGEFFARYVNINGNMIKK